MIALRREGRVIWLDRPVMTIEDYDVQIRGKCLTFRYEHDAILFYLKYHGQSPIKEVCSLQIIRPSSIIATVRCYQPVSLWVESDDIIYSHFISTGTSDVLYLQFATTICGDYKLMSDCKITDAAMFDALY